MGDAKRLQAHFVSKYAVFNSFDPIFIAATWPSAKAMLIMPLWRMVDAVDGLVAHASGVRGRLSRSKLGSGFLLPIETGTPKPTTFSTSGRAVASSSP